MVPYPHRLRVWVKSPEAPDQRDQDTGVLTETSAPLIILYDGSADVQESPATRRRSEHGEPSTSADAVAFLEREWPTRAKNGTASALADSNPDQPGVFVAGAEVLSSSPVQMITRGAQAVITWEDGSTQEAEVVGVRRLDGAVLLRRASVQ